MKRGASLSSKRVRFAIFGLVAQYFFLPMTAAQAAVNQETFGLTASCAIQTSGLTITQNSTNVSSNSATSGNAYFTTSYGSSYGMVGCNMNLQYPATSVVVTFPVSSQPNSFSFYAGAVDSGKVHIETVTYTDDSWETFTVKNANPNTGETVTVLGNGKLIKSFSLNPYSPPQYDFWFFDNLRWEAGSAPVSNLIQTIASERAIKGLIDTVTATSNGIGTVTFFANGKRIAGCISLPITTSRSCYWRPTVKGTVRIYSSFTPSGGGNAVLSSVARITVQARPTLR